MIKFSILLWLPVEIYFFSLIEVATGLIVDNELFFYLNLNILNNKTPNVQSKVTQTKPSTFCSVSPQ